MNLKNLSVKNKTRSQILEYLNKKKISRIYKKFAASLKVEENLAVAVSGGPDSLALAYLAKCYAIKKNIKIYYFIVDHRLRSESSLEATNIKNFLKSIDINCEILKWNGKKPTKNIQAIARNKRYSLLINQCKKKDIKHLLLGHHLNDVLENFLIRIVRGSGLNGLISFNKISKYRDQNINILRPLLDIEKKDLIYITKIIFNFYVNDPSNKDEKYKRTRIRNLLHSLEKEGLDIKKLELTINNLKDSDRSIKFYVDRNLNKNSKLLNKGKTYILNKFFFDQSHEVIFRSLTKIIQIIGRKYYPVRGKSIDEVINAIKQKSFTKLTLGGCIIERINETILISRESVHKV